MPAPMDAAGLCGVEGALSVGVDWPSWDLGKSSTDIDTQSVHGISLHYAKTTLAPEGEPSTHSAKDRAAVLHSL